MLMLWLTIVVGIDHRTARSINLLFFLPSALIAIFFRWKQGHIPWKKIFPAIIVGSIAALAFSWLGNRMDMSIIKKFFGGLMIFTGLRELTYRPRKFK